MNGLNNWEQKKMPKKDIFDGLELPSDKEVARETTLQKIKQSNVDYRKVNPRTEAEKYACGNNMRDKTLEEILGKDRALAGKEARRQANFKQDYTGRGEKIAGTKKAKGDYNSPTHGMNGKTHKESTKFMQSQKAQIRQDLKRKLGLGKNDTIPKELLEKAYKKQGL